MNTDNLQEKAGAKKYVSIFGKSTVDNGSREYQFTEEVTRYLIENDLGVIHGGYAGGIMQAVADTADKILKEKGLPLERNIAVPQIQHDGAGWARVQNASFTVPAEDIYSRLRNVAGHSDIAIIAPLGGDGTMLELTVVWHENVLAKYTGSTVVPVIVLQTENGTDWKKIIETLVIELDNSTNSLEELNWVHFASNLEEFKGVVDNLD
jgi:predicted Rossmann-fold nucleotide-binding protein